MVARNSIESIVTLPPALALGLSSFQSETILAINELLKVPTLNALGSGYILNGYAYGVDPLLWRAMKELMSRSNPGQIMAICEADKRKRVAVVIWLTSS